MIGTRVKTSIRARAWQPVLTGKLKSQAQTIAREVYHRILKAYAEKTPIAKELSFSFSGHLDLALSGQYLHLALEENEFGHAAQLFLRRGARHAEIDQIGIYGGLAQLGFVANYIFDGENSNHTKLISDIDELLEKRANKTLVEFLNSIEVIEPQYDLIAGLAGVTGYLLMRDAQGMGGKTLPMILQGLTTVSLEKDLVRFFIPKRFLQGSLAEDQMIEHGIVNCGLAHGVPGVLSVLSIAKSQNCDSCVVKLDRAIENIAEWLLAFSCTDRHGIGWPSRILVDESRNCIQPTAITRSAWCYGTPGVARSLWHAGVALARKDYQDTSVLAMEAVFKRPRTNMNSAMICHGLAGLLMICLRFLNDTGLAIFRDEAIRLSEELLDTFDSSSKFGFHETAPRTNRDDWSFLEGAAGIAMVLAASSCETEPDWDRLILLS